jgi:sn-glycerol 3-phosphate transport system permease protein
MTRTKEWLYGWLLLLPAMALLVLFTHYPAVANLWHSFYSTPRGNRSAVFVGIGHYQQLADDPIFWQALSNNLWYALGTIPLSIALALLMAAWVNGRIAGRGVLRLAYFTPTILPMIAVANIWLFFYTPEYGLLEQFLGLFGAQSHNWLGSKSTALPAMMVVAVWKEAGFFMIFYLAALQSMSPHLAEAAAIEGASRWYFFRRVTFPLLMPTTLFVLINAVINAFRLVDHVVVMTRGGPDNATALLLYYIYEIGFRFWDSAYAAGAHDGVARAARQRRAGAVPVPRTADALSVSTLPANIIVRGQPLSLPSMRDGTNVLETVAAWLLGLLWVLRWCTRSGPLSIRPSIRRASRWRRLGRLANFVNAWHAAPFARYFLNTVMLVTVVLVAQLVLVTLAAYAFARFRFPGRGILFALVLVQLMIMPDVLIVENYRTMTALGLKDTILAIGLPYMASAFGIFLLRQTFKTIPRELDEAARVEGCTPLQTLWKVYVPLARPTYLAYALVSVSYHWNNFLWPLIITNSVESRPVTVGLQVFSATDQGIDWSIITAATLLSTGPLLIAFLLFQRQFVQSFMRAGIR